MLYQNMIIAEFNVTRQTAKAVQDYMSFCGFKFSSASKRQIIAEAYYAIHALGLEND